MRSILFTALTLATFAGFAAEPQEGESGDKLTPEQLIRKLEELNAVVTYVPRAPERAVNYVAIDDTWTGGDEGIVYVERLAKMEESFRTLYVFGEPEISARRLKDLATAVSHLKIQRRGAAYLGVAGGSHPQGVQLIKVEPGSPADKAGLRDWDVIAGFDGKTVDGFETLVRRAEGLHKHNASLVGGRIRQLAPYRRLSPLGAESIARDWEPRGSRLLACGRLSIVQSARRTPARPVPFCDDRGRTQWPNVL